MALIPQIEAFFHESSNTVTYVVACPATRSCAIIDSCLDFDSAAGRTATDHADGVLAYVADEGLVVDWVLETHVHADHLSAAPYIRDQVGGRIAIGARITEVQHTFGEIYNAENRLQARRIAIRSPVCEDGETFMYWRARRPNTCQPRATRPACGSYRVEDNIFVGDTLFMPDFGTARCDFPGGDARTLYRSIRRILDHHPQTTLWICHDYTRRRGRDEFAWRTTIGAQREREPACSRRRVRG